MTELDEFGIAAERLAAYFAGTGPDRPVPRAAEAAAEHDYRIVRSGLERYVLAHFSGVGTATILELVDATLAGFLEDVRTKGAPPNAAGWITLAVRRRAIDELRRQREHPPVEDLSDDEVARLLDKRADAAVVYASLRRMRDAGDQVGVRVVTTWLRAAAATPKSPPSRAVAEQLDIHHSTVNEALERFRTYVEAITEDVSDL